MSETKTATEMEFWFEFGSAYSYLAMMRIEDEAKRNGVKIAWRPFLLGPVFQAVGHKGNPFVDQKEKRAYVLKDMERQCRKYGLKWVVPNPFPRSGVLPLRVALVGADKPWMGQYCRRVMELNYALDQDIGKPETLEPVLTELGLKAGEVFEQAQSDPIKARLRELTEEAAKKGIFGAPTFFIGSEMFWGNDRLDDALKYASSRVG